MMINSDKQLSPNQVVDISGFAQGARLPSNTNIHDVFGNCGQMSVDLIRWEDFLLTSNEPH